MKKIVIFSLLISITALAYAAGPQPKVNAEQAQQQLQYRMTAFSIIQVERMVAQIEKT